MTARFTFNPRSSSVRMTETAAPERGETSPRRDASADGAATSSAAAPAIGRDELFIPDHYERRYAYPLIVWLTPPDAPRHNLRRLMRRISDRNYFGLSLACQPTDFLEPRVCEAVAKLRRRRNLHTERVYLAGVGDFATAALRLAATRPEWFGGAIALSPQFEHTPRLLRRFDAVRDLRVFLGLCAADAPAAAGAVRHLERLLWTAGVPVNVGETTASEPLDRSLLGALNHWLIANIEQPEPVA